MLVTFLVENYFRCIFTLPSCESYLDDWVKYSLPNPHKPICQAVLPGLLVFFEIMVNVCCLNKRSASKKVIE